MIYGPDEGLLSVKLAGLQLHRPREAGRELFLEPDGLEGWDDGVDMRRDAVEVPQAHGAFDTPGYRDARNVVVHGRAWAGTPRRLAVLRAAVVGCLSDGGAGLLEVETAEEGELSASVRLSAKPVWRRRSPVDAEWSLQLWAADPRKFGPARRFRVVVDESPVQAQDGVLLWHAGNAEGTPEFVLRGDFPEGYRVHGPGGARFSVTEPLRPGQVHELDFGHGLLRVDGRFVMGKVTEAGVWTVPAGAEVPVRLERFGARGTGAADIRVKDTYI
ncbi:minor tail protein [Arthrobacter phage Galaxy]|uniref:Minor tail protein n=1 Tax=Arthrobacter phage Galaxy TaxID=1772326 RepID=A0A0U4IKT6_9CAUD|nr:minor tail protein [Arthrobacter phage Galaxy]ALY08863.1 minor tail protein [Arthrobacter phage Galaxy]